MLQMLTYITKMYKCYIKCDILYLFKNTLGKKNKNMDLVSSLNHRNFKIWKLKF